MRYVTILVLCLVGTAHADDFNAAAQACMSKLLETTQREIEVRTQTFTLQHDLVAAQAHIKALEDKYEPKPQKSGQ